jgi:hypothetical protein
MPSPKSIAEIKSALLHPATTSHFEVQIDVTKVPSQYLQENGVVLDQAQLNLLCSEAVLPGSNLATLELTNDHTGVTERHAYRRVYDDRIDLTFYVDVENYMPIRFFEAWIKFIANESIATDPTIGAGSKDPFYNYRFKYRDDYAVDGMKVTKFEKSMLPGSKGSSGRPMTYGFVKAYPISIASIPVSYESSSLLKCTVSLTYMRYYIEPAAGTGGTPVEQSTTPAQQAQFNSTSRNLQGTGALGTPVSGFNVGGVPTSSASSSGNTVSGFTVGANSNVA